MFSFSSNFPFTLLCTAPFCKWLTVPLFTCLYNCSLLHVSLQQYMVTTGKVSLLHFQSSGLNCANYAGCRARIRENPVFFSSWSQIAVFFYCAISLAPVQLGITCNTEVTQNGPRANRLILHRTNSTFPWLHLVCKQEPFWHKLVC